MLSSRETSSKRWVSTRKHAAFGAKTKLKRGWLGASRVTLREQRIYMLYPNNPRPEDNTAKHIILKQIMVCKTLSEAIIQTKLPGIDYMNAYICP